VYRVGMARIDPQNQPIELFGYVQASGLVVAKGIAEHILNVQRSSEHQV
jgi:hypothetical protein